MSGTSIAEEGTQSRDCSHVDVRLQRILRSWFLFFIIPTEFLPYLMCLVGFPGGSDGKASVCNARDPGLTPGWGRYPREGNGNPLQYSCLENPMDRGAW